MRGTGGIIAWACASLIWAATTFAADSKSAEPKPFPYHGVLSAVDAQNKNITLIGKSKPRVIRVTADTKFTRNGNVGTIADGRAGDAVAGLMIKDAAGRQQALTVRFGAKPEGSAPKRKTDRSPKPR